MILTSELSSWNLSRADTLFLSNVHGDNGLVLANSFLAAGVESVVSATGGFDDSQTMQQFESLRAVMGPASSVADGVSAFQRDVLRQTGHRLGAWSSLMVFGAGR
jgi:hypothetical protein